MPRPRAGRAVSGARDEVILTQRLMRDTAPRDTSPGAHAAQQAALAKLGIEGRLRVGVDLSESVREIAVEALRRRHPELVGWELRRAVCALLYGEALASRAYSSSRRGGS